jgi:hypothetical protein
MAPDAQSLDRLSAISRCTDELERVRALRPEHPDQLDGLLLAELDWLEELSRLLHTPVTD